MKRILVLYATKSGSSAQVARKLAQILGASGFETDCRDLAAGETADLADWDGVVIGAPINGMTWIPPALDFVKANASVLQGKKVACFLLSIAWGIGRPSMKARVPGCFAPVRQVLDPVSTACFGGVMDQDPPWILRLVFGVKKGAPRDSRDWAAVEAWAAELAGLFS